MGFVAERRDHRRLYRRRQHHPGVLAHREQLPHQRRIPADEAGPVPGEVGALGQRVHREHPGIGTVADGQHRDGCRLPAQRQVALVVHHDRAALACPRHDLAQVRRGQYPPGRVTRRVQPQQLDRRRPQRGQRVGPHDGRAGQARTHLVGRVADRRDRDGVPRPDAEQRGQPRDQLLGADRGKYREPGRRLARGRDPGGDGRAQVRRSRGLRVPRGVRGSGQRRPDHRGYRIDRRTHRQVHRSVRMPRRPRLRRFEQVPGEVGKAGGECQCSASRGGWPATNGVSLSSFPILEAPPGEPRSSKNS